MPISCKEESVGGRWEKFPRLRPTCRTMWPSTLVPTWPATSTFTTPWPGAAMNGVGQGGSRLDLGSIWDWKNGVQNNKLTKPSSSWQVRSGSTAGGWLYRDSSAWSFPSFESILVPKRPHWVGREHQTVRLWSMRALLYGTGVLGGEFGGPWKKGQKVWPVRTNRNWKQRIGKLLRDALAFFLPQI